MGRCLARECDPSYKCLLLPAPWQGVTRPGGRVNEGSGWREMSYTLAHSSFSTLKMASLNPSLQWVIRYRDCLWVEALRKEAERGGVHLALDCCVYTYIKAPKSDDTFCEFSSAQSTSLSSDVPGAVPGTEESEMEMTRSPRLRSSETCGRDNRRQLLILPTSHGMCQHGGTHRVPPRRRGWAGGGVWAGTPEEGMPELKSEG